MEDKQCIYVFSNGKRCTDKVFEDDEYCYWHSCKASKKDSDVKSVLEQKIKDNELIEGYHLKRANLEGVHFIKANLKNVNLERANLRGGHLFGADFEGANLFKADCENANLKNANLNKANLLGIKLEKAKLERVHLGKKSIVLNEIEGDIAREKGNEKEAHNKYIEAEEIYRNIKNIFKNQGLAQEVGEFFYREMTVKRKLMPKFSLERLWSKLVDFTCGYGEKPYKIISSSLVFIFINSIIFFFSGMINNDTIIRFNLNKSLLENLETFLKSCYFSVVTFTTLGYGDFTAKGFGKFFAVAEAFLGAFMMALFVITFSKKMMDR